MSLPAIGQSIDEGAKSLCITNCLFCQERLSQGSKKDEWPSLSYNCICYNVFIFLLYILFVLIVIEH